jgi:hypothetical protein
MRLCALSLLLLVTYVAPRNAYHPMRPTRKGILLWQVCRLSNAAGLLQGYIFCTSSVFSVEGSYVGPWAYPSTSLTLLLWRQVQLSPDQCGSPKWTPCYNVYAVNETHGDLIWFAFTTSSAAVKCMYSVSALCVSLCFCA